MACQKVAAGGMVVSGQLVVPVLEDGFGRGESAAEMKFFSGVRCSVPSARCSGFGIIRDMRKLGVLGAFPQLKIS